MKCNCPEMKNLKVVLESCRDELNKMGAEPLADQIGDVLLSIDAQISEHGEGVEPSFYVLLREGRSGHTLISVFRDESGSVWWRYVNDSNCWSMADLPEGTLTRALRHNQAVPKPF